MLPGEDAGEAAVLSLIVSSGAVLLSVVFGFPLAWVLARVEFPGRGLVRAAVMLPMVLPPLVGGVALLSVLGRRGLLGGVLSGVGVSIPYTTFAAVLAAAFVAGPFFVIRVEAGLRQADRAQACWREALNLYELNGVAEEADEVRALLSPAAAA